jgi:hypothetical protein
MNVERGGTNGDEPYLSYLDAQAWAKKNNIKTVTQWHKTKRPADIPSNPAMRYMTDWKGWKAFLGTDCVSYAEAQVWAKENNIRVAKEWKAARAAMPENFPLNPNLAYAHEWLGWKAFLGPRLEPVLEPRWVPYHEAQQWAWSNHIKSALQWEKHNRPASMPPWPHLAYTKSGEWAGWEIFLGTQTYAKTQAWAKENNIKSREEWNQALIDLPDTIPRRPDRVYAKTGEWKDWHTFLGIVDASYHEAQQWAWSNHIKSALQWKKTNRPASMPASPSHAYAESGDWKGWEAFLVPRLGRDERVLASPRMPGCIPRYPDMRYTSTEEWTDWLDVNVPNEH